MDIDEGKRFFHQGKSNIGGPGFDNEKHLKGKSTKELDELIKSYKPTDGEHFKAYIEMAKKERARRVGGVKESSMMLDILDMIVEFETPGLDLGAFKYDDSKKVIYATIGGKKYVFTPHMADKAAQIYASVTGMAKHSTGKALAFLKKNATGQKLNEALDVKWDHPTKKGYTYDPEISDDITAGFTDDRGEQTYVKRSALPDGHPAKKQRHWDGVPVNHQQTKKVIGKPSDYEMKPGMSAGAGKGPSK